MRLRLLRTAAVVAAAALAVAGLSACNTKVGVAAVVDGHQITESNVNSYLTVNAQPVKQQNSDGSTFEEAPRSFVLSTLIYDRLLARVLAAAPGGLPSESDIAAKARSLLNGLSAQQAAASAGITGFSGSFYQRWLHQEVLRVDIRTLVQSNAFNIDPVLSNLHFPVSVSPRYGAWDAQSLGVQTGPSAGVPDFVTLHPSPASGSGSPTG